MRSAIWRRLAATVAATALGLGSLAGCGGDESGDGPAKLRFFSLAWQKESVTANKEIVKAWNKANPDIQVEYVQGSWDSAHDQLLTSFEGDDAPDVIHYEAALAGEFADRGYLADLKDLLPKELKSEIGPKIWDTVTTSDGAVFGVPFLLESQVVLANRKLLESAGIEPPGADQPWTWDEFADNAKKLTKGKQYGAAWAMKQPVNRVLNLSMNYGGGYFDTKDGRSKVTFGDAEAEVPERIHDMVYKDKSAAPSALSMGATDPLPGFFAGKYAMLPGSIYLRQQMVEEAPKDFDWVTLPPLQGDSQDQAANPQTLSIAETSEHKEQAMKFMSYFLSPKNMAELAMGDWLVPTGKQAGEELLKATGGEDGWDVAVDSADSLVLAPFQRVPAYPEWKTKIATPAFQEYFANKITINELRDRLVKGGERVLR
ncbi:MAG: ABC transporter substrate-binding protein [Micromonosporaceae bacterium]